MSHIDSDLEEGEIPDDSPSSPLSKPKELPRRYILGENKGVHQKHKKDCKYAIRRHAKKLVQLKMTPAKRKNFHKSHHKSYSHNKSARKSHKHNSVNASKTYLPKIVNTYSLAAKRNSPFKDHTVFRPNSKPVKTKSERYPLETKAVQPINDCSISKMLESHKSLQMSNSLNISVNNSNQPSHSLIQNSDSSSLESAKLKVVKNVDKDILLDKSSEIQEKEETDDIEELRRIALATVAKRNMAVKQQTLMNTNVSASEPAKVSPNHISNCENHIADNYEVIDMDVDEDNQNSLEIVNTENSEDDDIFIIDTKPSLTFQRDLNSTSKRETIQYCSDDDFEADLLRAELIESLYRKRSANELANSEKNEGKLHNLQKVLSKPNIEDNSKPGCNKIVNSRTLCNIPKHIERNRVKIAPLEINKSKIAAAETSKAKTDLFEANKITITPGVNKSKISHVKVNKAGISSVKDSKEKIMPDVEINNSPKRLIISLNGESSSEESDQEGNDPVNSLPENPVASIEALISDIRQKSDSKENNEDDAKAVPKAVSCLSKAQQEEYNALMKILEKKKVSEEDSEIKNKISHSPLGDLKLLEKKLTVVKETLRVKKELMAGMSKEVTTKKYMYLKSKLTAQHLKEKYVAAEKERRIKLDAWSKSCKSFDVVKKSVSEWENKVIELQSLCSKVGLSIQRQNGLPSDKTEDE